MPAMEFRERAPPGLHARPPGPRVAAEGARCFRPRRLPPRHRRARLTTKGAIVSHNPCQPRRIVGLDPRLPASRNQVALSSWRRWFRSAAALRRTSRARAGRVFDQDAKASYAVRRASRPGPWTPSRRGRTMRRGWQGLCETMAPFVVSLAPPMTRGQSTGTKASSALCCDSRAWRVARVVQEGLVPELHGGHYSESIRIGHRAHGAHREDQRRSDFFSAGSVGFVANQPPTRPLASEIFFRRRSAWGMPRAAAFFPVGDRLGVAAIASWALPRARKASA